VLVPLPSMAHRQPGQGDPHVWVYRLRVRGLRRAAYEPWILRRHYLQVVGTDADYRRKRAYQMSPARYRALLARQGGKCAGCDGDNGGNALHVDHDHACCPGFATCGECVRGLLCFGCNGLLGKVEELGASHPRFDAYLANPPAGDVPEPEPPFAAELALLKELGLR
jgi:hypothetical protein